MKKVICRKNVWVLEALFSEGGWVPLRVAVTRCDIREMKKVVNWPHLRIRKYFSEDVW